MNPTKAGACGRMLRLVFGVCVMIVALPVWFVAGWGYNLRCLGIMAAPSSAEFVGPCESYGNSLAGYHASRWLLNG